MDIDDDEPLASVAPMGSIFARDAHKGGYPPATQTVTYAIVHGQIIDPEDLMAFTDADKEFLPKLKEICDALVESAVQPEVRVIRETNAQMIGAFISGRPLASYDTYVQEVLARVAQSESNPVSSELPRVAKWSPQVATPKIPSPVDDQLTPSMPGPAGAAHVPDGDTR